MQLRKQAHTAYRTQYHIIWITRYRRKILTPGIAAYLRIKLLEVNQFHPDWEYITIGMDKDHVHLHIIIPPKYAVSQVVETIKKNTSKTMKEKFKSFLDKVYWDGGGIWGTGYFVSTIGINEEIIQRYIDMQGKEEAGQAKLVI